jgi:hypothetical protein
MKSYTSLRAKAAYEGNAEKSTTHGAKMGN